MLAVGPEFFPKTALNFLAPGGGRREGGRGALGLNPMGICGPKCGRKNNPYSDSKMTKKKTPLQRILDQFRYP